MLNFMQRCLARLGLRRDLAVVPALAQSSLPYLLVCAVCLSLAQLAEAQGLDPAYTTMGLETVWRGQVQMPLDEGRIVSMHLWSAPGDKRTFAELTLPAGAAAGATRTLRESADRLGLDGKPVGIEAAKKAVETRAARMLGRASGVPAIEVSVPMIYLVVVTSDGYVQSFDAETGQKLWSNSSGPVHILAAPASVSAGGVAVVQGADLYLYDLKTGKELTKRKLPRASSAGVAVVGSKVFTASLPGQLVALDLGQTQNLNPWTFQLYGRVLDAPAASSSNNLVAFAADDGTVTVLSTANPDKIEPWFHFSAREPMAGPVTFCGDGLYCGDVSGQVAKIGVGRLGSIEWRFIIGDSLGAQPLLINKTLFATSEIGNLFAINDADGTALWPEPTPRVKSLIAAAGDHLYCRSLTDRLLCVDIKSGKIIAQSAPALISANFTNSLNDRLYLVSTNGRLTCLRRAGKDHVLPTFYEAMPVPTEDPASANKAEPAPGAPAMQPRTEATDTATDPFGTGASNAAPMNNAPAGQPDPADPFAPAF